MGSVSGMSSAGGGVALPVVLRLAIDTSHQRRERAFVVGGMVRDLLMNRTVGDYDLDIVVEGNGLGFAADIGAHLGGSVKEHPAFLTAKVLGPFSKASSRADSSLTEIDIATARQEVYEKPGALPCVRPATIGDDLWRRDFSANAIALELEAYLGYIESDGASSKVLSAITDPCGGLSDIQSSTLRILHPRSFIDDPTRLFRAVRYLVRLSFHFDMPTLAGFVEAVKSGALSTLSPRRVWNEVLVALDEENPAEVIQEFAQRGLCSHVPVVSIDSPAWVLEAIEHLAVIRSLLGPEIYRQAGRTILIANLLRDGREDVARAVHEGNKVFQRAQAVLAADKNPEGLRMIPDVAAAYCVYGSQSLRELLEACLREVHE